MTIDELPLHERVGYDYAQALRELLQKFTYEELADRLGYKSGGSLTGILKRNITPSHIHGEAIWSLYRDTFNRKPPMSDLQKNACEPPAPQA